MTGVIAGSLCAASQAAALTACEAILPTIEHVGLKQATPAGALLEAQINPHNSATTYEFVIVAQQPGLAKNSELTPDGPRTRGGPIPAGAGSVTVSGLVTGLQPGYTYWYEVDASNLAGEAISDGDNYFGYYSSGEYPEGLGGMPYRAEPIGNCSLELVEQEAERIFARTEAERQQHAREHEEQAAQEAGARYAAEAAALKQREQEMDAEAMVVPRASAPRIPACVVPALRGDTLNAARRAIDKAHCRLGKVREAARQKGKLVVVAQSRRHGEKLAGGTAVSVTLAAPRSAHRPTG